MAAIEKGKQAVEVQTVAAGLTAPVKLTHAGDSRLFIADQTGQIRIIKDGLLLAAPFLDISSKLVTLRAGYDERGLLGLAFHPDYAHNGRFYVYYSAPTDTPGWNHRSVVSEFTASPDAHIADPATERVLLTFDQPQSNHNGGDLAFGPDGYLYITSGDGGNADDAGPNHTPVIGNAQDTSKLLGKILRLDVDRQDPGLQYGIPESNPFAGAIPGADEIYAYGLRNPYRFSFDRGAGHRLFAGDVGQNSVEEVDIIVSGGNYGWKAKEGTHVFDRNLPQAGYIEPIAEYLHTDGGTAVIGGFVYRGGSIGSLVSRYVFGELARDFTPGAVEKARLFYLVEPEPTVFRMFEAQIGLDDRPLGPVYLKGFGEDVQGELYVLVSGNLGPSGASGAVLRVVPVPGAVNIDIKPGTAANPINLKSRGTVPVAVLSTDEFDARTVDPTTVTLAGAPVVLKRNGTAMASIEDVNGDGLPDLVVHVAMKSLQLSGTDVEAVLEGRTFDGATVRGVDLVTDVH